MHCSVFAKGNSTGADTIEKHDTWHGFKRHVFSFEGKEARVVFPDKALDGNPWVWRARFPDWHTEMDSMLLSEGFHIAWVNTGNQFGSPKAMQTWANFYDFLREKYKLNEKLSLEGVSRGGLFIYNYAIANPEKINCIYAEAPVTDFKYWPGKFKHGKGDKEQWALLMKAYGFKNNNEAKAYTGNPVDKLEPLAKERVPVMHMIGLNDQIVPPQYNTFSFLEKYVKLGGIATIVPCTEEPQELEGHHFPIQTPRLAADFIKYHTKLPSQKIKSSDFHEMRNGLRNSFIRFTREKKGRVAFLGGSITYNPGWRDSICAYLQNRFPDTEFEFIAAGIPSMGTTPAAFRLERDVLASGPVDLLFEEAAVNDATNQRTSEEQINAMEGIVRHVRKANPLTDIVMMHFVSPGFMEEYRESKVPEVIRNHERVARHYQIPSINLAKEVTERIDAGEFSWEDDFRNLHPSPFGQNIYYQSIKSLLEKAWLGYVAEDDKMKVHQSPAMISKACYDKGYLLPATLPSPIDGWTWTENWKPSDNKSTRENYTDVPMLIGNYQSDIYEFEFEGTVVGIAVASGPDAGMIDFCIDEGKWQKLDLFTEWSSQLHLPWYYTLASGLEKGKHKLKLKMRKDKHNASTGNVARIRYFYINK